MNPRHLGFTGTQKGMSEAQMLVLRGIVSCFDIFHHGDCVGADAQAHNIAEELDLDIVVHPPISSKKRAFCNGNCAFPQKPYLDRNKDIVNFTSYLVAMPGTDTEILRSGTWSTVRYARKHGRSITIVLPDGKIIKEAKQDKDGE